MPSIIKFRNATTAASILLAIASFATCASAKDQPKLTVPLNTSDAQSNTQPTPPADTKTSPAPNGPDKPARKTEFYAGPDLGVYLPASSKTRSRFGSSWIDFGPSIGSIYTSSAKGSFSPDLHILGRSNNDDFVLFALLGVEYRRSLLAPAKPKPADQPDAQKQPQDGKSTRASMKQRVPDWIPYVGASADFTVGDLRSIEDNVHSGVRTGAAASEFLGITYRNRGYVEVRSIETTVVKGFDLTGLSLNVGFRIKF